MMVRIPDSVASSRPGRTMLHIGTMKSGTSYLQDVLDRNRESLDEAGVGYFGRGTRAVWDVLAMRQGADVAGSWNRLVEHAGRSASPTRLLSMELLSTAGPDQVDTIVRSFDDIEVIITARDLARVIPSAWQNLIKHGSTQTFEEFVLALLADRKSPTRRRFWRQHDLTTIVERWSSAVGPDRVHIVTVPPSGASPTLLWERFSGVLGVDPGAFDASATQTSNFSLTYSDAELLRRMNERLGTTLTPPAYNTYVRTFVANDLMRPAEVVAGAPTAPRDVPALGQEAHAWATEQAESTVRSLEQAGIDVIGDLRDLVPAPLSGDLTTGPSTPPAVVHPELTVRMLVMLVRKLCEIDPEVDPPVRANERGQTQPATVATSRNDGGPKPKRGGKGSAGARGGRPGDRRPGQAAQ